MTIDQLLTDVSPLLPVRKEQTAIAINHYVRDGRNVDELGSAEYIALTDYSMHAIKHFPAMLAALREIAELPEKNSIYCPMRLAWQALATIGEREPLNHTTRLEDAQAARQAGESVK